MQELRSELQTEKARGEEIWEELTDTEQALAGVRSESSELKKSCNELRSQLEQERADREEVEAQLVVREKTIVAQRGKIQNLERGYGFEETPTEKILRRQIRDLEQRLSDLKQKPVAASRDLPEAAEILNQLKSKRKKSKADLVDVEVLLELLASP